MGFFKKTGLPVFLAGMWIGISEFVRNEVIFKSYWLGHYQQLGIDFPDAPVNAAVWMLWSFVFAAVIFSLSRKFSLWQTTALAWVAGFVMMWLVIGNLNVLPISLLVFAVPLSILEAFLAAWICQLIAPTSA